MRCRCEFLRKVEDAEMAQELESAQQGGRFTLVDEAEPRMNPKRARWKYLAAGLAASSPVP